MINGTWFSFDSQKNETVNIINFAVACQPTPTPRPALLFTICEYSLVIVDTMLRRYNISSNCLSTPTHISAHRLGLTSKSQAKKKVQIFSFDWMSMTRMTVASVSEWCASVVDDLLPSAASSQTNLLLKTKKPNCLPFSLRFLLTFLVKMRVIGSEKPNKMTCEIQRPTALACGEQIAKSKIIKWINN